MFKFQSMIKKTSIFEENLDYYKRLSMDSNVPEGNGFAEISGFS